MEARASLIQHTAAQEHAAQRNRARQRQCKTSPGPIGTPGDLAPVRVGAGLVGDDSRASTADAGKTIASIGLHLASRGPPRFCFWFGFNLIREPTAIGETHRDDGAQPSTETALRNTQELKFCQKSIQLSTPRPASGGVSF